VPLRGVPPDPHGPKPPASATAAARANAVALATIVNLDLNLNLNLDEDVDVDVDVRELTRDVNTMCFRPGTAGRAGLPPEDRSAWTVPAQAKLPRKTPHA
jgi:hypothetical protein